MATPQPQQVNLADLNLAQLGEVRKQLDEVRIVSSTRSYMGTKPLHTRAGAATSHQLVRSTQASPGKVQVMHRKL